MKADSSLVLLSIFAILLGSLMMYLLIPKIAEPSMKVHGNQQAHVLAKTMASSINALSIADTGVITKVFDVEWNVETRCGSSTCNIIFSYKDTSSDNISPVIITKIVEPFTGRNVDKLRLTKEGNGLIRIEELGDNE
jgi:hypothetical protein